MKFSVLYTLWLLVVCQARSLAQPDSIKTRINQVERNLVPLLRADQEPAYSLQERMEYYHIKGLSIAVIHNYKLEWVKGYGWAEEARKIPVTTHTLFQAGSISKSLNAVGVLNLVQQHKLNLYTDINRYLKTWQFPYDSLAKGKKITMAHLLSHSAGLNVHGFDGYEQGQALPTLSQLLNGEKPANSPAIRSMYAPGIKQEYSGGGTMIAQAIVMDLTGQPYAQYMDTQVLKPMGMTSSTFQQPPTAIAPKLLSSGYYANGKPVRGHYHIYPEQAAAGLWTTATDLSTYIIETQLALTGKSAKVLNGPITTLRLTPYLDKSAAMGVYIHEVDGATYFEHEGQDEGFSGQYYGSLQGGNGLVILTNTDFGLPIIREIVNSIAKAYGFKGLYRHPKSYTLVTVSDSTLNAYAGDYQFASHNLVTIAHEGNHFYLRPAGQQEAELFAESQTKFFCKVVELEIEFIKDATGKVIKALFHQHGVVQEAQKIK